MTQDQYTVLARITEIALCQDLVAHLVGPPYILYQWRKMFERDLQMPLSGWCVCGNTGTGGGGGGVRWTEPCTCTYQERTRHQHLTQQSIFKRADMVFYYAHTVGHPAMFRTADNRMLRANAEACKAFLRKHPHMMARTPMHPSVMGRYQTCAAQQGDLAVRRRRVAAIIAALDECETIDTRHWEESGLYCQFRLPVEMLR